MPRITANLFLTSFQRKDGTGPQQVESKIDQDSFLSGQLTLWDQHGSKVIRGNVLAIPVNNTLLCRTDLPAG